MKKYTQPTVEITAFDFEDITMSTFSMQNGAAGWSQNAVNDAKTDLSAAGYVVVEW